MNKITYYLLIIVATFLTLLTEVGIPIIIVGFGAMFGFWNFSWTGVILLWIGEQALLDIKNTTDILFKMVNKNGD